MFGMQRREEGRLQSTLSRLCWDLSLGLYVGGGEYDPGAFWGIPFDVFVGSRNVQRGDGYSGRRVSLICSFSSLGYFICVKVRSFVVLSH
jgi:hypothetical protein